MKSYHIVVTLFGPSAKNAGIIGTTVKTRSDWSSGKLEYVPVNDGSQRVFLLEARDDNSAYIELTKRFNAAFPGNRKPLSGKSYLRHCRL